MEQQFEKLGQIGKVKCKINPNYEPYAGDFKNSLKQRKIRVIRGVIRLEKVRRKPIDQLHEDICEECCGTIDFIEELEIQEGYH